MRYIIFTFFLAFAIISLFCFATTVHPHLDTNKSIIINSPVADSVRIDTSNTIKPNTSDTLLKVYTETDTVIITIDKDRLSVEMYPFIRIKFNGRNYSF